MTPISHEMFTAAGYRYEIAGFQALTTELVKLNAALLKARQAADALAYHLALPKVRRALREYELGYAVPDFAWESWEYQRRTLGTGNGKVEGREAWE